MDCVAAAMTTNVAMYPPWRNYLALCSRIACDNSNYTPHISVLVAPNQTASRRNNRRMSALYTNVQQVYEVEWLVYHHDCWRIISLLWIMQKIHRENFGVVALFEHLFSVTFMASLHPFHFDCAIFFDSLYRMFHINFLSTNFSFDLMHAINNKNMFVEARQFCFIKVVVCLFLLFF